MARRPLFKDRICAVIAAPTAALAQRQIEIVREVASTLELRLDWLRNADEIDEMMHWATAAKPLPCLIATCRRKESGGQFPGRIGDEAFWLTLAGNLGFPWRDMPLESAEHFGRDLRAWLMRGKIILSYHDFKATPRNLARIRRRLLTFRPDAVKVATQCNSYADSLRVLALCNGRRPPRRVIAVPMGEIGLPARVLALKHGSALAYAAVGQKTAPGQLTLEEMKYLYRADKLDPRSRVYGVIGNPVSHSLSPLLHNTGFIARGMNDVYLPFLVPDLRDFLRAVEPLGLAGFSVTLPHKQAILRHLDDCDPLAAAIGAVNTVVVRGTGKLYGYNTDYVGVLRALQKRVALRGSRVLLYGAGGAARAISFALAQEGAIVNICARRPAEARKLARAAGGQAIERRHLR
ncbi:MAG: type I 3-dehydroquinate dehydratase, partial [Candidatus Acidiferrales bacterium]